MFCPNDAQVNAWYEAVFTHMATQYGVEGVDITHARYPMTSEPRGMFLCPVNAVPVPQQRWL